MKFAVWLLFGLTLVPAAPASAPALSVQDGEYLRYRVSWAVLPGAGEIKIEAHDDPADPSRLIVTSTTATRRMARMLLHFEAKATSIFDRGSGKLLSLHEANVLRGRSSEHTVAFDLSDRKATYTKKDEKPQVLPIPPGDPTDLITALLNTRYWNLKPGEKRDALVLFDDDFYELTIYAVRYEEVKTPLGTFKTLLLEPRMEKTAPKGMFKKGSTVHVWISQDEKRLPVRFEVAFKIGTGTATLEAYQPPGTFSRRK